MDVQRVRGEDKPGQVSSRCGACAAGTGASGGNGVDQRQHLGDLGGVLGDFPLADDHALAVHQRGEQLHLHIPQLFPRALEHLAVQRDHGERGRVAGSQPPRGDLGQQPAAGHRVGLIGVDHLHVPADRGLVRGDVAALDGVPAGAEAGERVLGQVGDEVADRAERPPAVGQPGRGDHGQRRGDLVADAAFPARVADLRQRLQQAGALPGKRQRVQVDHRAVLLPGQQRVIERRGQDGGGAAVQRAQPHPLGVAVMVVAAGAAAIAERVADRDEARSCVAGAGVSRGVGERLHRHHPVPVHGQVVAGQPAQRPRQHRRGQVRGPASR